MTTVLVISDTHGRKENLDALSRLMEESDYIVHLGDGRADMREIEEKYPEKTVWCYTGFEFERLTDPTAKAMLSLIDVLVDGKFVEELKSPDLIFRGSSNQRIIDVKKSLEAGEVIWLEGVWRRKMGSGNIYE